MRNSLWRKRLNTLIKKGAVATTAMEQESGDFRTCATGERMDLLKSVGVEFDPSDGMPLDNTVQSLSYSFDRFFRNCKYKKALEVLDAIDDHIKTMKRTQIAAAKLEAASLKAEQNNA